jgi:hypothetical protein
MYELSKYLNTEFYIVLVIAVLASAQFFKNIRLWFDAYSNKQAGKKLIATQSVFSLSMILFYFGLLVLCSAYLLSNTYNPFIYYRF